MGFWDSFNASQHSYREFSNSIRDRSFTFNSIDQSINQLNKWKSEFESLNSQAYRERNPTPALKRVSDMLAQIDQRINRLLELRKQLNDTLKDTREKIQRIEEGIHRLDNSLKYDTKNSII